MYKHKSVGGWKMKTMRLLLLVLTLTTTMFNVENVSAQYMKPISIMTITEKNDNFIVTIDEIKLSMSAIEKSKELILPKLSDELGFLEQSVILVRFAIENRKSLGGLGICILIMLFLVAFLKSKYSKSIFKNLSSGIKRLIIIVLGQIIGVIGAVWGGAIWYEAIVSGLFVSSGAVAIFEAVKPLLSKNKD